MCIYIYTRILSRIVSERAQSSGDSETELAFASPYPCQDAEKMASTWSSGPDSP